jgi:hypothetical protein
LAHETDAHLVIGEMQLSVVAPVDEPAFHHRLCISMDAVNVPSDAPRNLAHPQRPCTGERLEDALAVGIQRRQKRFLAVERISTDLRLAAKDGL